MRVRSMVLLFCVGAMAIIFGCSEDKGTNPDPDPDPVDYGLITVPATTGYPMGSEGLESAELPVHTVILDEFHIGRYEVTYELWYEVRTWAESNGYVFENAGDQGYCYSSETTGRHPVVNVNWRDCIAWCNAYSEKEELTPVYYTDSTKSTVYRDSATGGDIDNYGLDMAADGFRLPTEAEWEYAARYIDGTQTTPGDQHSGYDLDPDIDDCAWHSLNAGGCTHEVGELAANSLGACDMSGNAWEWCWDAYSDYPDYTVANPTGSINGDTRILRGGGLGNSPSAAYTSNRNAKAPDYTLSALGFRLCRGDFDK